MQTKSLSHEQLYRAVRDGNMPPDAFDHESHIRLAWYYLTRWPYDEAVEKFNADFRRFIVKPGAQSKYHKTITDALLQLIASHLEREECRADWQYFRQDAKPLFCDALGLLRRFYSAELMDSEIARKAFKDPDLKDLPEPHLNGETL